MKKVLLLLFVVIFVASMVGCGQIKAGDSTKEEIAKETGEVKESNEASKADETQKDEKVEPVTIKAAHVWNEDFSAHKGIAEFKRLCEEKSEGNITVEIYPNSQLGNERELLEGSKMGTHDIAMTGAAGWAVLNPDTTVFELPFLYRDMDHQKAVFNNPELMKTAEGMFDKIGLKMLCYYGFGIRSTMADTPIRKLEDFEGLKIRVPEVPIFIKTFEGLGAIPTPISYGEAYSAIQSGVVQGVETSPESFVSNKFYEVCDYLNMTKHQSPPIIVAMNKANFEKMSPEQQKIVMEAAKESSDIEYNIAMKGNEKAIGIMKEAGIQIIEIEEAEMKRIKEKLQPVVEELASSCTGIDGMAYYKEIQSLK